MSNQNLKNKSIDELREMLLKGEAELKVLHNKSKYYESQINLLTRKERTHRLLFQQLTSQAANENKAFQSNTISSDLYR